MRDVLVDERRRIVDDRAVSRQQPARREIAHELQRREVGPQVAALPRRNDDRPSLAREVAAVEIAGLAIEEAEMIRGVARRRQDLELPVAGGDGIAGRIHHHQPAPPIAQRRQSLDVIGMPVRDQHARERRAVQRGGHGLHVLRVPDAGVDERGLAPRQQPGVVAGRARPLGRIAGGNEDRRHSIQKKYFRRT